jgi:hypothetical protein
MGKRFRMGYLLVFRVSHRSPATLDGADNRLSALVDVNMFNRDFLLTLTAIALQCLNLRGVGAAEFVGLVQVLTPRIKRLIREHGAPVALHHHVVSRHHLRG